MNQRTNAPLQKLNLTNLPALISLQSEVINSLTHPEWLRENTTEIFTEILTSTNKLTASYGIFAETSQHLLGAVMLTDQQLSPVKESHATLKLILVSPTFRAKGLASTMLENTLTLFLNNKPENTNSIACTIHADNQPSKQLFTKHGFKPTIENYNSPYGPRTIFLKTYA